MSKVLLLKYSPHRGGVVVSIGVEAKLGSVGIVFQYFRPPLFEKKREPHGSPFL
jgi:hypothetical protein